ncbi:hypothetical protein RTCIAT899_CH14485 [Rhizobium tropici CIAT 899]|nr:hypothetical protein RTCIAT899_CH14485 [Rhizobium tropici CIAT 899]
MGGCNLLELLSQLNNVVQSTHFWRATIPSMMSAPVILEDAKFESEEVSRFLERETSKAVCKRLEGDQESVIIFEAAADFANAFLRIGDTIIPDIRNDVFGAAFKHLAFDETSELAKAAVIRPDEQYYWVLWKHHFNIFYHKLLKERIQRGVDVVFLSRRFCLTELRDGEFVPLQNLRQLTARNSILNDVENFISAYEGVKILKSAPSLEFTSADAPWGGPWEFHPNNTYYADMRCKFLDMIFPGEDKGSRYLANWIAENEQNANNMRATLGRTQVALIEANNITDEMRHDRDLVERDLEATCAQRDAFARKLDAAETLANALRYESSVKENAIAEQSEINEILSKEIAALRMKLEDIQNAMSFSSNRYSERKGSLLHRLARSIALHFDTSQLRKFGFNEEAYLEENEDVRKQNVNALRHYVIYGMKEGRSFSKA